MEGNTQREVGNSPMVSESESTVYANTMGVKAEETEKKAEIGAVELERDEEARSLGERVMISSGQLARGDVKNTELGVVEDVPQGIYWGEKAQESSEALRREVAIENYGRKNVDPNASMAGVESKIEVEERLNEDAEDAKVESGTGWNHDIMTASAERMTWSAVAKVDKEIKEKAPRPGALERTRHLGMVALLKGSFGRDFGSRN